MVEQTKRASAPFFRPGRRAQHVLDERIGEAKDLDVVDDISSRFSGAVVDLYKIERARLEAKTTAVGLKSAKEEEAVHDAPTTTKAQKESRAR